MNHINDKTQVTIKKYNKQFCIQKLTNVKLVIGNGFDLQLGLKTTYADYFNRKVNLARYKKIQSFLNGDRKTLNLSSMSIWDLYFFLESYDKSKEDIQKIRWCDIETSILNALKQDRFCALKHIHEDSGLGRDSIEERLRRLVKFISSWILGLKENDLPGFLLNELKTFEQDFGTFIKNTYTKNLKKKKVKEFLDIFGLSDRKDYIIDSFNYGCEFKGIDIDRFWNINGTTDHPIFGIDSSAFSADERNYIFTKAYRRNEFDGISSYPIKHTDFDNAIIYGHSLCEADYSYFFPLLDNLHMKETTKTNQIVFAFSSKHEDLEEKYFAIARLFSNYAEDKGYKQNNRLLDSLQSTRRVVLFDIDSINKP